MPTAQTIPEHLFVQWVATGRDQGVWRASDGAGDPQFLDRWALAGPETRYEFEFSSSQGSGHPYVVLATLTDGAGGPVLGVRIEPNSPSSATVLGLQVRGDHLRLGAAELLSDAPKLIVSKTKPPAAVCLTWSAGGDGVFAWTYTDGTTRDPIPYRGDPIEIGPDANGAVAIRVTDRSLGAANHTCAAYYRITPAGEPAPSNVGMLGASEAVGEDGEVELSFVPERDQVCLYLFTSLQTSKPSLLCRP
jgi:hypothetical protein